MTMTTTQGRTGPHAPRVGVRRPPGLTATVGGFFTAMGGVHLGIVAANPQFYATFADGAWLGFVRTGWSEVFMAAPNLWGMLLAAAELTVGVLMLVGGRQAVAGWVGTIVFHVLLLLFGPGTWAWCLPVLPFLVWGLRREMPRLTGSPAS